MTILNLIRPEFARLIPYRPGGDELKYRLHNNESPSAPVSALDLPLNQYPDYQLEREVQKLLAGYYKVNQEQIALTRGSDDGIDLLMRLFLIAGQDSILQCPPTFPMYRFYAQLQNAVVIDCPLNFKSDFSLDLQKLFSSWREGCKLVMLCSPNNPTGNCLDIASIAEICAQFANKAAVVVDEAYIDFSARESAISLLPQYENLIILRTLSKAYGLASVRVGAVVANEAFIQQIKKIIPPYHLSAPVLTITKLALKNSGWLANSVCHIVEQRQNLIKALEAFSWIEIVYPSEANFILIKSQYNAQLQVWLASHDIAVRQLPNTSELHNMLRLTVGDAIQNTLLLDVLNRFKPTGVV
ncbi:histidinol-phosphate transaminase [Legionella quinlivanii]|uniref:histidinol-phosphate transaminase n=1 Tax=Legionella quinlivanii TaxID=45073 RepID=UPI0022440FA7|nr:histidinol-phosphate transaminase [Legionella quinlivanii]MCW8451043.1 histidinol-phosphate transaminase [Legionella quinlivanii]